MNYPDYFDITISIDYLTILLIDRDISISIISIIEDIDEIDKIPDLDIPIEITSTLLNIQSVVLSLDPDIIEVNLILEEIIG